jgi:autotransporter-associated beta strand protein
MSWDMKKYAGTGLRDVRHHKCWRALALAMVVGGSAQLASATGFIWTGTTNSFWDTLPTDLNWTTAWSNNAARSTPNTATFNLAVPTAVSVSGNIDAASITFATGGWTLADGGGVLAFGSNGALTVTTTIGTDTINAVIANGSSFGTGGGTTSLTKAGIGTLILGGADTYTGSTTVSAGVLQITSANAIAPQGTLSVNGGATASAAGTLDLNGLDQTIKALSGSSAAVAGVVTNTLTGTTSLLTVNGTNSPIFNGVLQDGAGKIALSILGSGTTTLTGQNHYTGPTILSGGNLTISSTGSIIGTAITINAGSTLRVVKAAGISSSTNSVSLNSVSLQNGALSIGADASVAAFLANSSTGGNILLDNGGAFTSGGTNSIDFSTLPAGSSLVLGTSAGGSSSIAASVVLKPDLTTHTLHFGGGAGTLTVSAAIADIGGIPTNLNFVGPSTTVLAGNSNYTGQTTVNASAVVLVNNANGLGSTLTGTTINTGGTLNLSAASAEPFTLAGGTLNLIAAASGPIALNSGVVKILAGGSAAANSITLSGGTLSMFTDVAPGNVLSAASTSGVLSIDTSSPYTAGGTNAIDFSTLVEHRRCPQNSDEPVDCASGIGCSIESRSSLLRKIRRLHRHRRRRQKADGRHHGDTRSARAASQGGLCEPF